MDRKLRNEILRICRSHTVVKIVGGYAIYEFPLHIAIKAKRTRPTTVYSLDIATPRRSLYGESGTGATHAHLKKIYAAMATKARVQNRPAHIKPTGIAALDEIRAVFGTGHAR